MTAASVKVRLTFDWTGKTVQATKVSRHTVGTEVNLSPDQARELVRLGRAVYVGDEKSPAPASAAAPTKVTEA